MTTQEQITTMTTMDDRFGSTEEDVAKVIQELKVAIQPPVVLVKPMPVGTQAL